AARWSFCGAGVACVLFVAFGEFVIEWFFGARYSAAYLPMVILIVGALINAGFGPVGALLLVAQQEQASVRLLWFAVAVNLLANTALVPSMGAVGAALATCFSIFVWNFALWQHARTHLHIDSSILGLASVPR
ncbi:MAG: polysaccharide biosynthesis C-terminal domain-containing protein, partial [Pseudomonadota bacterium]